MSSSSSNQLKFNQCIQKQKRRAPHCLPTETWIDVFQWLSRRDLLRSVQPSCSVFHAICERHVPNVHVVRQPGQFIEGLRRQDVEMRRQLAQLMADDASLSEHFLLDRNMELKVHISSERRYRILECVLQHSRQLFQGCQLELSTAGNDHGQSSSRPTPDIDFIVRLLALFQTIQPSFIFTAIPGLAPSESDQMLCHPTVLNCMHLVIDKIHSCTPSTDAICRWLHFLPAGVNQEPKLKTRKFCLGSYFHRMNIGQSDEIIARCKQLFELAQEVGTDRRAFMFMVPVRHPGPEIPDNVVREMRLENSRTGELFKMEYRNWPNDCIHTVHIRRCLLTDESDEQQLQYGDYFDGYSKLRFSMDLPKLVLDL